MGGISISMVKVEGIVKGEGIGRSWVVNGWLSQGFDPGAQRERRVSTWGTGAQVVIDNS
jgi:hypothetical protein